MKALDPHIARGLLTEDASSAWEIIGEELRSLFFTPLHDVNPVENLIRREKTIEPLELLLGGGGMDTLGGFLNLRPTRQRSAAGLVARRPRRQSGVGSRRSVRS
jgi:hypothetical protein